MSGESVMHTFSSLTPFLGNDGRPRGSCRSGWLLEHEWTTGPTHPGVPSRLLGYFAENITTGNSTEAAEEDHLPYVNCWFESTSPTHSIILTRGPKWPLTSMSKEKRRDKEKDSRVQIIHRPLQEELLLLTYSQFCVFWGTFF